MTRQRIRPSLRRSVFEDCPCCTGTGLVKTPESVSIEVMRLLMTSASQEGTKRIEVEVHEAVSNYLSNKKRRAINDIEDTMEVRIEVNGRNDVNPNHLTIHASDEFGNRTKIPMPGDSK